MAKPAKAVISIDLDATQLRKRIYDYTISMKWTIVKEGDDYYQIRTGFTWWTWGELITVSRSGDTVTIESKCSPNIQLLDWGKNQGNVNMLVYVIGGSEARPQPAASPDADRPPRSAQRSASQEIER